MSEFFRCNYFNIACLCQLLRQAAASALGSERAASLGVFKRFHVHIPCLQKISSTRKNYDFGDFYFLPTIFSEFPKYTFHVCDE